MEPNQDTETNPQQNEISEAERGEAKAREAKAARTAEAKLMSISIAMFMAIVAMLGAVTAYRAALGEQETLRYERRLQQGEMLELVHRQELLSKLSSRTRYENSVALHSPAVDGDQGQAGKPVLDRRQAALKKLLAEEEAAHVRSLQPYLDYFDVYLPYKDNLEASIAMHSANWLRALGFDTVWEAPKEDGSFPSIWKKLEQDVVRGRHKVLYLAAGVVLFVVALAVLTFAQLSRNRPRREKILVVIGGVLALAGLVVAMWADRTSWRDFVTFTVTFGALALVGTPFARRLAAQAEAEESANRRPRSRSEGPVEDECGEDGEEEPVHPAEVDPALFAGLRLHTAPAAHTYGRMVIRMIAISAVLSALSGLFYSRAAVKSSEASSEALENQANLFRLNSRQVTVWNYWVGRLATAEDHHLRYEAARQRLELAKEAPDLLSQKDALDQVQLRRRTLETFEKNETEAHQLMTGELGPEQDVHFPWKLVISESYHEPAKALARWSANNEKSLGYQREATTFLALLTFFAIALYLLGQALGMGRTSAASYILVGFACLLAFAGACRGLFIWHEDKATVLRPASTECRLPDSVAANDLVEQAAEHFARGWVLYEGSPDDPADSAQAAKEFGCAVQIRPTFAAANLFLARATNRASTPQLNEGGFVSLLSKDALDKVSQAEQQARDLLKQQGFAPPMDLVGDVGFDTYAAGLVKRDRQAVERGRQATVASLHLDQDNLVSRFNLGMAQMAEGNEKEALETYRQTMALGEPGHVPFVPSDAAAIGGAITDLDVFRQYCGGLNDAAYCQQFESVDLPKLKSELVTAAWPPAKGRTLAGSGIKLTGLHLTGSAAGLGWSGRVEDPPRDSNGGPLDTLAVLWYAYSPDWKAWRVLPAISERVNLVYYALGDSHLFYSVLRASSARICMQSGAYRAEFYVDGELAGTQEITLTGEDLEPQMFPDLDVAVCRPSTWQRWQPRDKDAVWTRGYLEESDHRGVFVFSFFDPQQNGREATELVALRRAENILHSEGLAPQAAGGRQFDVCTGLHPHPSEVMAAFSDGRGNSIAKAWTTKDGLVNVVAVVDPHLDVAEMATQTPSSPSQSQTRQDCEILLSATSVRE
jgi:hypothetical protein